MPKAIDITGMVFGRLTVIRKGETAAGRAIKWLCKCSCGKTAYATSGNLRRGGVKSCGCLNIETVIRRSTKHGDGKAGKQSKEYKTLYSIKYRCLSKNSKDYHMYGGRGIKICDRWLGEDGYANFLKDMGRAPSPMHSIDRKDNNGDYEPGNCRWATPPEQMNNKGNNIVIEHDGQRLTARQWERKLGIKRGAVSYRYRKGKPIHEILAVA